MTATCWSNQGFGVLSSFLGDEEAFGLEIVVAGALRWNGVREAPPDEWKSPTF